MPKEKRQVTLPPEEMPRKWYNILPDLPEQLPPPQDPETGESRIKALPEVLLGECLKQEFSTERWIDIPEDLIELYMQAGRPRPMFRALSLEKRLGTPARMYYKGEFFSPTGSHKVNTAIAQSFYAREEGYERVTTETGAGQWGTALAYGASLAGLKCTVFWVRAVYNWKADRRALMEMYGAEVYASPSDKTDVGRPLFEKNPNHNGSLGIAISEGLEDAKKNKDTIYCLGSVLNHVLMHQTIIGLESKKQFEIFDDYPDLVISCIGGGSNFGGFALPFLHDVLKGECRQHAYLDKANAFASMPIIELPGRQEDYEEGGKKLVPRPGMIVFRGEGEEAGRVSWAAPNLPAGILESLIVYDRLLGKAQAAVLRGEVPRGIEAGYPMSLMIGQARLMFGIPLMNLQVVLARALEMVRLLIRDVIKEPLYAWGKNKAVTLKPEDCEGAYRVRVDFEASTAEGMMNEALGLQKLRQGGSISSRTEMELNPLIKNPTKELHRKKAESLFEHPTLQRMTAVKAVEALYGAKEALAVEQAMVEGEEGAVRKGESTGIPPGGKPESELPESVLEQAVLSKRSKALRGNE